MKKSEDVYKKALQGKKLPILTLDNKWHKLFTQAGTNSRIEALVKELNELLMRQGKVNTESKEIRKLKKKLMNDIMESAGSLDQERDKKAQKKVEDNKRLIEECNEKLDNYKEELQVLPEEIDRVNYRLMLATMDVCYDYLQENTKEIEEIEDWLREVRVELKKKVIRKQEKEQKNNALYSYMHDIFGADVIEIFDMKYDPGKHNAGIPVARGRQERR